MPIAILLLLFLGLIPLPKPDAAPARPTDAKKAFLDEYEPAEKRIEEFYRAMRLKARVTAKVQSGESSKTVQFMANGRMLRLEIIDPIRNGKALDSWVAVSHPNKSFQLVKKLNSKIYEPTSLMREYFDYSLTMMREGEVVFAPFVWQHQPIIQFLRRPDVTIEAIENVSISREPLRKVSWKQVFPPDAKGKPKEPALGWFLFDPSHGWVLRGYEFGQLRGKLEYSKSDNVIPLLKRIESWRKGSDGSHLDVTAAEIQEIVHGEIPEKEFTLAAFGLPETAEVKSLPPADPNFKRPTMPDTGAELEAMRKETERMSSAGTFDENPRWMRMNPRWLWVPAAFLIFCFLLFAWVRLRHPP